MTKRRICAYILMVLWLQMVVGCGGVQYDIPIANNVNNTLAPAAALSINPPSPSPGAFITDNVLSSNAPMLMSNEEANRFDPVTDALKAKILDMIGSAQWSRGLDDAVFYEEYEIKIGNIALSLRGKNSYEDSKNELWFFMPDGADGLVGVLSPDEKRVCIARRVCEEGYVYDYLPDGRLLQAASWHDLKTGHINEAQIYWDGGYRLVINGEVVSTWEVLDDKLVPPSADNLEYVWMTLLKDSHWETQLLVSTRTYSNGYGTSEDWTIYWFDGRDITPLHYAPGEWERTTLITELRDDGLWWRIPGLKWEMRAPPGILSPSGGGIKEDIESLSYIEKYIDGLEGCSAVEPDVLCIEYNDNWVRADATKITFLHPISAPTHYLAGGVYITYRITSKGLVAESVEYW